MNLLFDEELTEAAVFLAASGGWNKLPALQLRRFHIERERLYRILDQDERAEAFARLHLTWFREWGFEQFLAGVIAEHPAVAPALAGFGFRRARRANEEGAELFVNLGKGRNAIVALKTERFRDVPSLRQFLHHELTHVRDMVSPSFGYSPDLRLTGSAAAQERLVRERYRILWDVTIDGRLAKAGKAPDLRARRFSEFSQAYSFWTDQKRGEVFEQLWRADEPRHDELLHLASDPRDLAHSAQPLPGAPCPLCQFPTFEWAPAVDVVGDLSSAICAEFPHWLPGQGVCARCLETYRAARTLQSFAAV
jgi:hypothetical protein